MDQNIPSSPTTPAPYGHACVSCSQSKCKCIVRPGGGPCERCRRLNRECRPAETVRRRSSRKPAVSKTALLERKIDGLVSLIKARGQSGMITPSPDIIAGIGEYTPLGTSVTPVTEAASSLDGVPPVGPQLPGSRLTPGEAEEYLVTFQTYRSKYLPFISIPSTTTAKQLQQERPFLWLCLMAAGSKSTSQKQVLGREIRQTVGQEIVVRSERSIDLLLGLLTFISCAHDQIGTKPFLTVYVQLAISLLFDLGLNKPVAEDFAMVACVKEYSKPPTPRSMEERRAVLGCFLITSVVSLLLQKIDPPRWTSHMDECLQVLAERKECPNDEILVQQVRTQHIVQNIAQVKSHYGHTATVPPVDLESLYAQFQNLKTELLAQPDTNEAVLLHLYSAELEITLAPVSNFLRTKHLVPQQRQSLRSGLETMKSWFDVFFNIPPVAYIGFSFTTFSQLFQCLHTLYWPTTLDDPNWDEDGAWKKANTLSILDHVLDNLDQVALLAGLDSSGCPEKDPYIRAARKFRSVRPWWAVRLGSDIISDGTLQNHVDSAVSEVLGAEFFDDDWLMELLIPPTY